MNDPMTSQMAPLLGPAGETLALLEMALLEREREIDLLKCEIDRYKRQGEEAQARAAMVQAALDRHFEHCSKDNGAIQRLMARLAEATAQCSEKIAIIQRRDRRIAALQKELGHLDMNGSLKKVGAKERASALYFRLKRMVRLPKV